MSATALAPQPGPATATATAAALLEDVEFLAGVGCGIEEVARRVGYANPTSLEQRIDRLGRRDLVRKMAHNIDPVAGGPVCRSGRLRRSSRGRR